MQEGLFSPRIQPGIGFNRVDGSALEQGVTRDARPAGLFTLGFDIGTGIFGDPAGTGALGHTADGPGPQKILGDLTGGAQRGYVIAAI